VRLNLAIGIVSGLGAAALLVAASRADSWYAALACAIAFAFVNLTNFSLLHEAVHGMAHPNPTVNRWLGRYFAIFFPTTFTLQRRFHLGHHRRNRGEEESFDLYSPGDRLWLKRFVIYCMPSGLYWLAAASVNVFQLFLPALLRSRLLRNSGVMTYSSFSAMLEGAEEAAEDRWTVRFEVALCIAVQVGFAQLCGVSAAAWLLCYWIFGMHWGSLQYTDHVLASRDTKEGAWNLRITRPVQAILLNYNCHLVHHRDPGLPWVHLPKLIDNDPPPVSFWRNFWLLMRGPYPAEQLDDIREVLASRERQAATSGSTSR
jgi:fatty acid desaturase